MYDVWINAVMNNKKGGYCILIKNTDEEDIEPLQVIGGVLEKTNEYMTKLYCINRVLGDIIPYTPLLPINININSSYIVDNLKTSLEEKESYVPLWKSLYDNLNERNRQVISINFDNCTNQMRLCTQLAKKFIEMHKEELV